MIWIYAAIILGGAAGIAYEFIMLWYRRSPSLVPDTMFAWKSRPLPMWREGREVTIFIGLHMLSVAILMVLLVLCLHKDGVVSDSEAGFGFLSNQLAFWGAGYLAFLTGSSLSYPLASALIRPVSAGVTPRGVWTGRVFLPWSRFSYVLVEPETRFIRLQSATVPQISVEVWQLPDADLFDHVAAQLCYYLPSHPPQAAALSHNKALFILLSVLITLPFVVGGVLIYWVGESWTWPYYPLATLAMGMLLSGSAHFLKLS